MATSIRQQARHRQSAPRKLAQRAATGLEALIEYAHARKLRVNNLFEVDGGWRANVTDGRALFEFGSGPTPYDALRAALARASDAMP